MSRLVGCHQKRWTSSTDSHKDFALEHLGLNSIQIKALTKIAHRHNVNIHLYADDTQLNTSFRPEDSKRAMEQLELYIEEIRARMGSHFLKLNDSKTEFLIFGTEQDIHRVSEWSVTVGGIAILPSATARNIDAYLDREMYMKCHINNTTRTCYSQLRSLTQIRKYLSTEAIIKLCHAFITSRLDNMNSILFKIPDYQIQRLQNIQNNTARLINKLKKTDHITPVLIDLHWLPVEQRIKFKILLLVYKCLNDQAPPLSRKPARTFPARTSLSALL